MTHRALWLIATPLFVLGATFAHSAAAERSEFPIAAIWRVRQLDLDFYSVTTIYSCDALERKVAHILESVGARADIVVDAGCSGHRFVRHGTVKVTLAAPVAATPENVRRETTYDAREELVARLRRFSLPTSAEIERFPAAWQRVSLTRNRRARIEQGDCDLVAAMREQIFPELSVDVAREAYTCPAPATRIRPQVEVIALLPSKTTSLALSD